MRTTNYTNPPLFSSLILGDSGNIIRTQRQAYIQAPLGHQNTNEGTQVMSSDLENMVTGDASETTEEAMVQR